MKFARVLAMLVGGVAIGASGAAMAGLNVGVNIGVPAPVYVAPAPVYAPPPPVVYQPAPVYVAPAPAIFIGWHGDRYWDGRRYWGRDDWYRHHGRGEDRGRWGGDHDHGHGRWH
ncbi:PXPV repeat protein [Paraburkholderia sp.]|uniref:PXPV repeat protein n=1 Tax=Paraburkholderia sp. TaxID=1926495 RepID=UPI0025CCB311|nr:PXPV repeat protein [Paraburkholderia sp.]